MKVSADMFSPPFSTGRACEWKGNIWVQALSCSGADCLGHTKSVVSFDFSRFTYVSWMERKSLRDKRQLVIEKELCAMFVGHSELEHTSDPLGALIPIVGKCGW